MIEEPFGSATRQAPTHSPASHWWSLPGVMLVRIVRSAGRARRRLLVGRRAVLPGAGKRDGRRRAGARAPSVINCCSRVFFATAVLILGPSVYGAWGAA